MSKKNWEVAREVMTSMEVSRN